MKYKSINKLKLTDMRKLFYIALFAISFSLVGSSYTSINKGMEYHKNESFRRGYKGNIHPDDLPKAIRKYLKNTYPDYYIMVSKRKGNGNYFVKIRYGKDQYRSYYRSLVFNHDGSVIKG